MTEDFICFIWKFRQFSQKNLKTIYSEPVEIITPGIYNKDAGPDFSDVKVRINNTLWAGNAEVHIQSSDWERHKHGQDEAYNNVVLHIVYEHDKSVLRNDGTEPPTLELKNYITPGIEKRYHMLMENLSWIPCEKQMGQVDEIYIGNWLSRMLIERLEEKSSGIFALVKECKGSWDDAFYIQIARNFGLKVNALPFELLARSLPQQILGKHKNSPLQTEALLFGQAGLLNEEQQDVYTSLLTKEYHFLKKKYSLKPIDSYLWKFLRLRPQNFPTLRIAQFSALILKSTRLFSQILEIKETKKIADLFKDLRPNPYWDNHYRLGKVSTGVSPQLGQEAINNILINTVAVMIFSYGKYIDDENLMRRAVDILENLPSETNHITKRFNEIGVACGNADRSQALLQLKKSWCDKKNCLFCAVGAKIINSD